MKQNAPKDALMILYNDTKGMGSWNFNDSEHGIYLGTQDEKEFFLALLTNLVHPIYLQKAA